MKNLSALKYTSFFAILCLMYIIGVIIGQATPESPCQGAYDAKYGCKFRLGKKVCEISSTGKPFEASDSGSII